MSALENVIGSALLFAKQNPDVQPAEPDPIGPQEPVPQPPEPFPPPKPEDPFRPEPDPDPEPGPLPGPNDPGAPQPII